MAARGPSRADALRALAVLERVAAGGGTAAPDLAQQLSDALLPILIPGNKNGRGGRRADEAAAVRVLGVLAAVWSQAAEAGGDIPFHRHYEDLFFSKGFLQRFLHWNMFTLRYRSAVGYVKSIFAGICSCQQPVYVICKAVTIHSALLAERVAVQMCQ